MKKIYFRRFSEVNGKGKVDKHFEIKTPKEAITMLDIDPDILIVNGEYYYFLIDEDEDNIYILTDWETKEDFEKILKLLVKTKKQWKLTSNEAIKHPEPDKIYIVYNNVVYVKEAI